MPPRLQLRNKAGALIPFRLSCSRRIQKDLAVLVGFDLVRHVAQVWIVQHTVPERGVLRAAALWFLSRLRFHGAGAGKRLKRKYGVGPAQVFRDLGRAGRSRRLHVHLIHLADHLCVLHRNCVGFLPRLG